MKKFLSIILMVLVSTSLFAWADRTDIPPVSGQKTNAVVLTATASTLGGIGNPLNVTSDDIDITGSTVAVRVLDSSGEGITSTLIGTIRAIDTTGVIYDSGNHAIGSLSTGSGYGLLTANVFFDENGDFFGNTSNPINTAVTNFDYLKSITQTAHILNSSGNVIDSFGQTYTSITNIEKINGTTFYNPSYVTSIAGVDNYLFKVAMVGVPDIWVEGDTRTAYTLTQHFTNGAGLNVTVTASGEQIIKETTTKGKYMLFGAGKALTITPLTGKSVIIDRIIMSTTGADVYFYDSVSQVAKISSTGTYDFGWLGNINESAYFYSSVSTTPDSIGWIKYREE